MVRPRRAASPTWRAFLDNHLKDLVALDFFVVPAVTFKILFVFVVLAHARRRIVHFNVTERPTAHWTAQQISEAFPWEAAPRFLLRDRDPVYGLAFRTRVEGMGIEQVLTAPRSPWQNPFAERVIGAVRRECLDHVILLNERRLRRLLGDYFEHYHRWRCHRSHHGLSGSSACARARARACRGGRGSRRPLPSLRAPRGLKVLARVAWSTSRGLPHRGEAPQRPGRGPARPPASASASSRLSSPGMPAPATGFSGRTARCGAPVIPSATSAAPHRLTAHPSK